jgi:mRNA-degrading endonuclease YafQ of YafQ-DinJ toxin-antitoxin module
VPTYRLLPRFQKDWEKLTAAERKEFRAAVKRFIEALNAGSGRFPASLRVHRIDGTADVWSMTWADNGRATFQYGDSIKPGEPHIVWRRVGTHDIYKSA